MRTLLPLNDSIQEFEQARHDRLWDGLTLWIQGDGSNSAGSVYLLGYAVEMALKCAYFRLVGLRVSDPIARGELRTAEARARVLGVATPPESFHSVRFWCDLLRAHRSATRNPLATPLEQRLVAETGIVHDRWWVDMRYKANHTRPAELERLQEAATWFDRVYPDLYQ
jgi:hypothetical protein